MKSKKLESIKSPQGNYRVTGVLPAGLALVEGVDLNDARRYARSRHPQGDGNTKGKDMRQAPSETKKATEARRKSQGKQHETQYCARRHKVLLWRRLWLG